MGLTWPSKGGNLCEDQTAKRQPRQVARKALSDVQTPSCNEFSHCSLALCFRTRSLMELLSCVWWHTVNFVGRLLEISHCFCYPGKARGFRVAKPPELHQPRYRGSLAAAFQRAHSDEAEPRQSLKHRSPRPRVFHRKLESCSSQRVCSSPQRQR